MKDKCNLTCPSTRDVMELLLTFDRMELWLERLEAELKSLTLGENDITMATQLSIAYQNAFDDGVGFTIEKPDGETVITSMVEKISQIFEKNIEALKVCVFSSFP